MPEIAFQKMQPGCSSFVAAKAAGVSNPAPENLVRCGVCVTFGIGGATACNLTLVTHVAVMLEVKHGGFGTLMFVIVLN